MIPVNDFDARREVSVLPMGTSTARMARLRERRRRGRRLVAIVEIDLMERQKLVALGYLETSVPDRSALNSAVTAYFSDKLLTENVTRHR
jgi:hypothetical protein